MIYLIIPILTIYFLPKVKDEHKFFLLSSLFLILTAVRYGIGADYFSYGYIYNSINTKSIYHVISWNQKYEPLFKVLFSLFKISGISYGITNATISVLLFIAVLVWIYRNSNNRTLSLVLYLSMFYFVWTLSALRQGITLVASLYLLFDKKQYSLKTQVYGIILISLFHYSAFYLLIYVLFNQRVWNKKEMKLLLTISILLSVLPIENIFQAITFLPFRDKLLQYVTLDGYTFLNFGYQVRLAFSVLFILFYDRLEKIDKELLNNILFGFITYFLFSYSPIVAGRLSIYSYVLIIVLIPKILEKIKYNKISNVVILTFAAIYFGKEVMALSKQSGLYDIKAIPTIFSKENYKFDTYNYYVLKKRNLSETDYNQFIEDLKDKEHVGYDDNLYNFISWNPLINSYSIYNENGELSIKYNVKGKPKVYFDIMTNYYNVDSLLPEYRYIDLSGKNRSDDQMKQEILNIESENMNLINKEEILVSNNFDELPSKTKAIIDFPEKLSNVEIYRIEKPFTYHVVKARYYYDTVYIYLDENLDPMIERLFDDLNTFDISRTVHLKAGDRKYHINDTGKIIWMR